MKEPVEPWLRGTFTEFDALRRQVLHALEDAGEDVDRWCGGLSVAEMEARPAGVAPVGFHLRHIARSLDRLLTYAEGKQLSAQQMDGLRSELTGGDADGMDEFRVGLAKAMERVKRFSPESYEEPRGVGREQLPTSAGALLIHCAEHTQRHVGQAVVTARIARGRAEDAGSS